VNSFERGCEVTAGGKPEVPGRWAKATRIWQRIHVNHTKTGTVHETTGSTACIACTSARRVENIWRLEVE